MVNGIRINWTLLDKLALKYLQKARKLEDMASLSVEDACRHCSLIWKSLMPHKTGGSRSNINYVVNKTIGYVISPANVKPNNFYLNQFLEGVKRADEKIGATHTTVKGKPYKLRHGFFGAGYMSAERTQPFFKGIITDRVRGVIK